MFSVTSIFAERSKYDELLQKSSGWNTDQILRTADKYNESGKEEEAMVLFMVAVRDDAENVPAKELPAHVKANLNLGDIHYGKGNYSNALRYYLTGLKLSESIPEHPYLAVLYKNIGNVYNMFQDFEKGKTMYLAGLKEARRVKDDETEYKLLQNLVGVCVNLSDFSGARKHYEKSRTVKHEATDESRFMDRYIPALLLKYEGKYRESIERFKELARVSRDKKMNARYECSAYGELGRIYDHLEMQDSAIYYLSRCQQVAQAHSILYQYTESIKMLYTLYDRMGNRVKANELKDRYLELKDSIYNQRQFDMAKNQQFLYEMEKTERAIADMNERQARSVRLLNRQRIVLFTVLGVVALALFLLYYFWRQKKKLGESYRNLYEIYGRMLSEHRENRSKQVALARENEELRNELARLSGHSEEYTAAPGSDCALPSEPGEEDGAPKYERSVLSTGQKEAIAARVTDVMESETPFCSPDFSLGNLASLVDSNTKYVSLVINDVFKKNFSTFVNEYRVNLACERLADSAYRSYSMEGIGSSVGFRSGATFTSVFKKITGISPSVYKKLAIETRNESIKTEKTE